MNIFEIVFGLFYMIYKLSEVVHIIREYNSKIYMDKFESHEYMRIYLKKCVRINSNHTDICEYIRKIYLDKFESHEYM
jgi:hypothetical protein